MVGSFNYGAVPPSVTASFEQTNQNATTDNTALGQSTDNAMNQFTAGQQALQGQAGNFISNILAGGQIPQNFGMPQAVYDAAFANFNKYQAPMLAAQHGAGSPAINSSMQELQLQLAGMAGQQSQGNALDAFSQAANFAMRPIGVNSNKTNTASGRQVEDVSRTIASINTRPMDFIGEIVDTVFGDRSGNGGVNTNPPSPFGNF